MTRRDLAIGFGLGLLMYAAMVATILTWGTGR